MDVQLSRSRRVARIPRARLHTERLAKLDARAHRKVEKMFYDIANLRRLPGLPIKVLRKSKADVERKVARDLESEGHSEDTIVFLKPVVTGFKKCHLFVAFHASADPSFDHIIAYVGFIVDGVEILSRSIALNPTL